MSTPPPPIDSADRERATTTFDRNVVVTAGAGTGKTTLLVDRLVNLLMREPDPLRITDIVALTFTNKAANEMKARLRSRLESYTVLESPQPTPANDVADAEVDNLRVRYHLSSEDVDKRSRAALRYLERSEIGTIHSFAASLLRLYPLDAVLDPQFREDEGNLHLNHFDASWTLWLDEDLSGHGTRTEAWERALGRFPLAHLRELALALCSENIDLDQLHRNAGSEYTHFAVQAWLAQLDGEVGTLIGRYPKERKIERSLRITRNVIRRATQGSDADAETDKRSLEHLKLNAPGDWAPADYARARELIRIAQLLTRVDRHFAQELVSLLTPFARNCRTAFAREGLVTFDGLLVRARNLLRDHPHIRNELKTRFKAVLVDEFQDTDPLQYEILLLLCEQPQQHVKDWHDIQLVPGKVFVVGDPKQSIYAFRGADIEAYLKVVQEIIQAQNGVECRLTTNFRSQAGILHVVNGVFEKLIQSHEGLQPAYIAIDPGRTDDTTDPLPAVILRKVHSAGDTPNADAARSLEAESLAHWLKNEVLGKIFFRDRNGRRTAAQPGHVAYLMRSLTHVQSYLEPLRRLGIRYVVEGERNFYATQEVIDVVNLLRAIDNPNDRLALVGVLRSPLGGHNDRELFDLSQRNLLDYRLIASSRWVDLPRSIAGIYQRLFRLHRDTRRLTVGNAVARIFKDLPVALLAASTFAGEQAVANLEKVREIAKEMGGLGPATLKEVVTELERRVQDGEEEPESVLDEETLDAVKVMSIHKAKGLEFPIVVLVDAMSAVDQTRSPPVEVKQDWSTGLVGLHVGRVWNLSGVFLDEKRKRREAHERIRLLYVAMTRSQTQLVVSYAERKQRGSESLFSLLDNSTGGLLAQPTSTAVPCGPGEITVAASVESPESRETGTRKLEPDTDTSDWSSYAQHWRRRWDRYQELQAVPLFLTPTGLEAERSEPTGQSPRKHTSILTPDVALIVGEVTHRILENWDFQTGNVQADLDQALAQHIIPVSEQERWLVTEEIRALWATFSSSPAYQELGSARVLGRELPFVLPWGQQVMEGVIDVLYEFQEEIYVADYKTDQIGADELDQALESHRQQAEIYTAAVERSLDREVAGFKLILLRLGRMVSM